jgi:hypothetical protein
MRTRPQRGHTSPRELTKRMVEEFTSASSTILNITRPPALIEHEKGLYAYVVAKPIKRIARLLTADRELLILFSSFTDQQPRTIDTATSLIEQSEVRLEHSIAVIVHADPEGNFKLKNWGREAGLSVIPINAQHKLPQGDDLEKLMFVEFFSHDAFDVTGPVSDDARFYGRRSEALDIARQLQTGQVRSSLGIRKIGKTSIIHRILNVSHATYDCSSVMIDCSRDAIWQMSDSQLLYSISLAVEAAIIAPQRYEIAQHYKGNVELSEAADSLLAKCICSPRPILVFFDEIDYITPSSPVTDHWRKQFNSFWRNLRAVYQEALRQGTKLSLFVGGVSTKWFRVAEIDGIENAALAFVPEEYLSPLASGASAAMIKTVGRTSGLQFENDVAEAIANLCSNIPYWVRKAGSYIHKNISVESRPYQLSMEEGISLTNAFIESEGAAIAEVAITHLFRVYPDIETDAIIIFHGEKGGLTAASCKILERYGVITSRGGAYTMSGRMIQEAMKVYLKNKGEIPKEDRHKMQYDSLDEWAEELASLNASRNILERRLRGIASNFLRFDSLQHKGKGTFQDRVTKHLDPMRRSRLKGATADEVIERFTWHELTQLIESEWLVFQNLFNDKRVFQQNAIIINDRYDAHAKDADKADVALYRRALQWFKDILAKS